DRVCMLSFWSHMKLQSMKLLVAPESSKALMACRSMVSEVLSSTERSSKVPYLSRAQMTGFQGSLHSQFRWWTCGDGCGEREDFCMSFGDLGISAEQVVYRFYGQHRVPITRHQGHTVHLML